MPEIRLPSQSEVISSKPVIPSILRVPPTYGFDNSQGDTSEDASASNEDGLLEDKIDAKFPQRGYKRGVIDQAKYLIESAGHVFPESKFPNHYYTLEYGQLLIGKRDSILTKLSRSLDQHTLNIFAIEEANDFATRVIEERVRGETDPLTGLLNRAGYERQMLYVIEEAIETSEAFCIVVGDINGLKMINDTEGHEAGDKLIRDAAEALDGRHRSTDLTTMLETRHSGDEFRLIMPKTLIEGAQAWSAENAKAFQDANISIGLGAIEINPEDLRGKSKEEVLLFIEECSKKADAASYAAKDYIKKEGKNGSLLLPSDDIRAQRQFMQMEEARNAKKQVTNALATSA